MMTDATADTAHNSAPLHRLRRRREFLAAAKNGVRDSGRLFTLQMVGQNRMVNAGTPAPEPIDAPPRFGLTVTKKVAGAVGRNRIRRRLREALRAGGAATGLAGLGARAGQDYVIIARREALNAPFADILSQMAEGFARLQDRKATRGRRNQTERTGVPRDE